MNHDDFDPRVGANPDDTLLVKFEIKPRLDRQQTEKEGRPIYKDVEYIDIRVPGSPDNVNRPATQRDIERFPRHYAAFKNRMNDEEYMEGTPLTEWPLLSRSSVEELGFFGIKTVEQLAAVNDANLQSNRGMAGLKQKAKDWLEVSNQTVKALELKAELEKRDKELKELRAQVAELSAKKKPGRKKKVTAQKEE
jgi:hypothetical protein